MKHVSKRLVSMLLVLCMVLSVLPLSVFAAPGQTLKVAFRYRIVPAGGGSWSGEAGRSEEYAVQVDTDGAFELALPAGFEEVFPNAEFRGRLSTKLFDGWTGVGSTVAYDAGTKTARVTGCTDVLDETKTYLIDVVYNEQFYKVSFGDDIRENLTWNDIVKIPAVPASGDVNRWGLGWTANGRQYLPGGEARVSELFAGMPRGTTELELEPAYLDLTDRHIVLWTDGLSGEVYRVDTVADGETVPTPPDVGRLGYTFDGWDGDLSAPVTENLVLRAQWVADEIPVTYIEEHSTAAGPDRALVGGTLSFSADADEGYAPTLAGYSVMLGDEVLSVGYAALLSVSGQKAVYQMTVPAGDALQIRILTDETPMSCELSFYADDDLVEQKCVEKGGFVLAPVIPDKAGYNALYWTDGTENVEVGEKIENVTADARWYAVYEEATYTVSFYDADYELIDSSEVTFGLYFPVPEYTGRVPEGKTFLCWQGDDGQMLLPEFNGLMSYTHDLTFNPVFSDNTEYSLVKFVSDGALYDAELYERVSGQTLRLPAEPTKPGYTFLGWFGESDAPVTGDTPVPLGGATYHAQWEQNTYTVTLVNAEHVTLGVLPEDGKAQAGDTVVIGAYAQAGYESFFLYARTASGKPVALSQFGGEPYDVPDANGYCFVMPAEDVTVTVVEKSNLNTVQFLVDGQVYAFEYVKSGEAPTAPATPVKEGYTFVGWRAASSGRLYAPDEEFDAITVNETYHAEFEINTYNLTYYRGADADASEFKCILMLPDGSFVEFFNNDTTDMPTYVLPDVTFGDTVVLAEPMLPGYVFKGWVDGSGYLHPAGAQYTMPAHDVLLTAVWEVDQALSCLVRFVSDGQLYSAYLAFDGQTAEIPAIDPTASGKVFLGWQYGDNLYSNNGVKDFTVEANEAREMTLEAVWASDSYSVTYRSEGMDDETVSDLRYGELHVLHDAPERAGYLFGGWEELETGAVYNARQAVSITCDMLLRAIWTEVPAGKAAVKFVNNGDLYDIILVDKGSNGVAPETAPTRPGYTFVEWRCDALNSFVRAGEPFGVAADADDLIVYTAVYTRNSYKLHFNLDGGRPDYADIIDVGYGETVALADVAEKDGYVFIGWREDATGIIYGAMASYVVKGDADFTAVWEAASCVVRFLDAETGILYGYEPVSEGQQVAAPGAPTVSGKTFLYWVNQDKEADKVMAGALTPNIFKDTVYLAAYEVSTHNIAVAAENCAVTGVPTERVAVGTEIRFAVEANEGYRLGTVGLVYTDGLSTVVRELKPNADGLYTFRMPDADVTIVAKAEKSRFSIFAAPAEHSRIDAPNYANAGESVPVVVSVDPGYVLHAVLGLTGNDRMIPLTLVMQEDGSCGYLFTMPAADVTLQTVTVKAAHTVTFLDADNTLLAIVPVGHDELLDAALVPQVEKTGYEFSGWEYLPVNGKTFDPANDAVAESLIVRATYEGLPFTVEAGHVDNIKYLKASSGANSNDLLEGDKLTAKAGADVLVRFAAERDWAITGIAIVGLDGSKTIVEPILRTKESKEGINYYEFGFTMPTEHVKIDLYTVAKLYRVDVVENLPEAGDYTINGHHSNNLYVPQGNDVVIDIAPVPGYYVAEVTACFNDGISLKSVPDGTLSEDGTRYTFPMVGYDVTVTITYAPHDYNIDIETSNALTYRPDQAADPDQIIESLDPSYTTKGWIEFVGERNVWKDATNELNQQYKYLANGAAVVGERVAFRVVEWTGYHLAELTVTCDDGEVTVPVTLKDGIYYFDMPADHVVITAIFAENSYTVYKDAASEAHGMVELNGLRENRIPADYKQEVTVTVTPDDGYQVTRIYYVLANGDVLDFDAAAYENADVMTDAHDTAHAITFHMPASDVTVYAEYAPILYTISDDCAEASVEYTTPHTVGEKVVFTTKANYGYIITEVYVLDENRERVNLHTDTVNALYGGKYYFDMPASPVTIYVETMKDEFNVVYLANGKLVDYEDVDYLATANVAARVSMVSDAPVGYHFVGWTSADVQTPVTAAAPSVSNADFVIVKERTYIVAAYAKDEIDVHFLATVNGTVTEKFTGADNAAEYRLDTTVFGDVVQFTAVPDTGYEIDAVRVFTATGDGHDLDVKYTVSDTAYTFLIPATYKPDVHTVQAADVIVAVTFRKACYTLTKAADCETDGMISVNGSVATETSFEYRFMDPVTITATPKDGYYVASIAAQSADGSEKFEITGTKPAVDTIHGEALTLSFLMPACDLTYTVDYEKCDFSITTVFDAERGTVTTDPANIAQLDDIVTVTVEPKIGYVCTSVTVTYEDGEKSLILTEVGENRYTFTMPANAVVVTVVFSYDTYTLTKAADCETDGMISVNGSVATETSFEYRFMDPVTITATPKDGYYVASIAAQSADGSEKFEITGTKPAVDTIHGEALTLSFLMPACDLTYTVDYEKCDFSVTTVFDAERGTVTTAPANIAQLNDIVTVTVEPKPGYRLASLTATYAGGEKSLVLTEIAENRYTFTMPAAAVTVTALFEEVNYTVTLTVDGEATTALNGFDTVNIGVDYLDTVTVSVTPAAGWELTAITVDGGKITVNEEIKQSGGDYTFTMPEHDVAVEVKITKTGYGLKAYAINSFESGHGKVTLSPERVAYVGDLVTITADPDDGYRVGRVIVLDVNGKTVPVNYVKNDYDYIETWSFTMPASNVAITVKFEVQGSSYYDDVRTDAWYYNAVTFVTDRGYFNGVSEMLFAPYIDMNRAMFVTVLGRMANVDTSKYMGLAFSDLEAGMYYVPYVKWANENGIVLGRSDTIFDPEASITREEMAAIMYRYCAYIGMDMTPKNTMFMDRYTDRNEISDWAVTYVEWAVGCGLMRGMTDHTIDPLEHASRAQVAQVIMNFCDKVLYR